jgi:hypothetical protein
MQRRLTAGAAESPGLLWRLRWRVLIAARADLDSCLGELVSVWRRYADAIKTFDASPTGIPEGRQFASLLAYYEAHAGDDARPRVRRLH